MRIEDAVGDPVTGYRAPNFSIGRAQSWAYKILLEEGFRYDSSTYPILHDRYGQPSAPRVPYEIWRDGVGEPHGISDRHRPSPGNELSGRRGRLFPAVAVRADAIGHPGRQYPGAAAR